MQYIRSKRQGFSHYDAFSAIKLVDIKDIDADCIGGITS